MSLTKALITVLLVTAGVLTAQQPRPATAKEKVVHSFCPSSSSCSDGKLPFGDLVFDANGKLYGTTQQGGTYGYGTVFELTPGTNRKWKEKVLHSFNNNGKDAAGPLSGLIFEARGNLYGTSEWGGTYGWGTVFELTPGTNGKWKEKVLHSFNYNGKDGALPYAGLVFDTSGNLYGTTTEGGVQGSGTVFELTAGANDKWTEKVLYSFCPTYPCTDGGYPEGALIFDGSGALYGTTRGGGAQGSGTVFELKAGTNGKWTQKVLYSFGSGTDGFYPHSGLTFDSGGNLYGTLQFGGRFSGGDCGSDGCGAVFELMPVKNGKWTEKVLHSFASGADGFWPLAGLVIDASGNLYGTASYGGGYSSACSGLSCGIVFELTPGKNGKWTEKVLYSFNYKDGDYPYAGLIFDTIGNLYGTTVLGGSNSSACNGFSCGAVFEITP